MKENVIKIEWKDVMTDENLWRINRGLYAYLAPDGQEILYIGKVDGTTVRQRWQRSAKPAFWGYIENDLGVNEHIVLVGLITLEKGRHLTSQLIADIESLLIYKLGITGNIQSRKSRISRPGMIVTCSGSWPSKRRQFTDME